MTLVVIVMVIIVFGVVEVVGDCGCCWRSGGSCSGGCGTEA